MWGVHELGGNHGQLSQLGLGATMSVAVLVHHFRSVSVPTPYASATSLIGLEVAITS